MWLLMAEAMAAFFLLVFIVWWTMYAGRTSNRPAPPEQAVPPDLPGEER